MKNPDERFVAVEEHTRIVKGRQNEQSFRAENNVNSEKRKRFTKEKNPVGTALNDSESLYSAEQNTTRNRVVRKNVQRGNGEIRSTRSPRMAKNNTEKTSRNTQKSTQIQNGAASSTRSSQTRKRMPQSNFATEPLATASSQHAKRARTKVESTAEWLSAESDKPKTTHNKRKKAVKIIFLGGVGEIGKNITALEYGNDIIVIDAGMTFPNGEDMPGIDAVVPDTTYLAQNKDKIRGIFLTHGHEDHIGGLPYLMKELNPDTPIYATKLTLMLVDNKLQEHRIQNTSQCLVTAGDRIKAGVFEVEFINVNHSICGSCALAIRTPEGLIYHSGDFKIDLTPVAGEPIDLKRIAQLGDEGVLLYMSESTNIERPGYTMGEAVVAATLDHLFADNSSRRLIIATFASNIDRLQQIIDLAVKYNRKVAFSGRSMLKIGDAAVQIGELKIPDGVLVDVEKANNYADKELLIVSTGSQGEPMSALTRMAMGEFNKVTIDDNDTIVISAHPIPGNEKMIYRVINNLYKKGARVVYESLENIHVSGHACREEHKILHKLLKPKFFIPVHGEYRHLKRHAQLSEELGTPSYNILIPEIGNCVELTANSLKLGENVQAGTRLIDGEGIEDYGTSEVMKDRLKMSADGVCTVALAVTGNYIINEPVIEAHGCVTTVASTEEELKAVVQKAADSYDYEYGSKAELSVIIRRALKNYFYKKTKQSPLIVVSIVEV